jgi:hypothetical protein
VYAITIFKPQKSKSVLHNWTKVSQGLPPAALNTTHNCLIQIAWLAGINGEGAPHSYWCHVSVGRWIEKPWVKITFTRHCLWIFYSLLFWRPIYFQTRTQIVWKLKVIRPNPRGKCYLRNLYSRD